MPEQDNAQPELTESEMRGIFKALESSGVLKGGIDTLSLDEGKRKLLAELSRQGLGKITPDILVCNNLHYFLVVKPVPPIQ